MLERRRSTALEIGLDQGLGNLGIEAEAAILVAASGGADSTALLDALTRRHRGPVTVAHFNHLLRGAESDEDEKFVSGLAARRKLASIIEREDIAGAAKLERRNLEAVARNRRYDFLTRAAQNAGALYVLTAHTRDDQVETLLLRLLRGAGPAGWRGIAPRRTLARNVELLRPLLSVTRAEVIAHCEYYALDYRTDSTNLSPTLARNRVRREVLPLLRQLNPRADEAMLRAAAHILEDEEYLSSLAESLLDEAEAAARDESRPDIAGAIDVRVIAGAARAVRLRALREWVRRRRGDLRRIDQVHLEAIERLAGPGRGGREAELPGGARVRREAHRLVFI
ncbi:MAG: tRNA lysidine(34) synthetase TilS [Blastocatellales bacterium]|nr:tRNA lysidine(34) synthetase TilS [Blastocatellales bacterium]